MPAEKQNEWWVYVIRSQATRVSEKTGKVLQGFFYVGSSTDPRRRLRQHNGELKGGARWTTKHRPHRMMAV